MPENNKPSIKEELLRATSSLGQKLFGFIIPMVCLVAAGGLILGLILPGIQKIREARELREVRKAELSKYQDKNQKLGGLLVQTIVLDSASSVVAFALPDADEIPQLMTELQAISQEAAVTIATLQYSGRGGSEVQGSSAQRVTLQMSVDGDFSKIEGLLGLIEQASRIITVDRVSVGIRQGGDMFASLALSSYFLPPETKQNIDAPVTLDLNAMKFRTALERVRALKQYDVTVVEGGVGKTNPFVP